MEYVQTYQYLFSSRGEVERQLSVLGIEYQTDDQVDNEDVILEAIERATAEAKSRLNKLFADINLQSSPWVRYRVTLIACYFLSIRRGNVDIYGTHYYQALEEFQMLADGELFLEELPRSSDNAIVFQNYVSDNRTPMMPIRVDSITSSTVVPGQVNLNRAIPFSWF